MNRITDFLKSLTIGLITCALYASSAHGEDFGKMGNMALEGVLDQYILFDDKAQADEEIEDFIKGFAYGMVATYSYAAGIGSDVYGCMYNTKLNPTNIRKLILKSGSEPDLKELAVGAYVYLILHLECTDVLGDYETSDSDVSS